jgi:hypothetical protein
MDRPQEFLAGPQVSGYIEGYCKEGLFRGFEQAQKVNLPQLPHAALLGLFARLSHRVSRRNKRYALARDLFGGGM